jgi:cytochrome P450
VTRHADILEVERQNELFHNGDRATTLVTIEADAKVREMMGGSPHLVRSLVQMDNPDHMAYRRLTHAWFMPHNLRQLEDRIREIARGFVDRMAAQGDRCDFARDVAIQMPLNVILAILGLPESDYPRMLRLTQELFGAADEDLRRGGSPDDIVAVVQDFFTYFTALTEHRRAHPTDDLASVVANATIDGEPLTMMQTISYYVIAATAGHDTTASAMAGGLHALLAHPDQLERLRNDPTLMNTAVDEMIRWVTPVKHFMRTATVDYTLRGTTIEAGQSVLLSYPSGNRDEDAFVDPFRFDVGRTPNKHLSFGFGVHYCLGAMLARMELKALFTELLPRLDSIELAGEPALMKTIFVGGLKRLPVRYELRA